MATNTPAHFRPVAAVLAVVLMALAIAACGNGPEADSEAGYVKVLRGLKRAAIAGRTYDGAARAEDLDDRAERNTLLAFCKFAWQVGLNGEGWKLPQHLYVVNRVRSEAYAEQGARFAAIVSAMAELYKITRMANFDAALLSRYRKACYR